LPGPPLSPRAPFCASKSLLDTNGFQWSNLQVHHPPEGEGMVEEGEDLCDFGSFSEVDPSSAECLISSASVECMKSVVTSSAEEVASVLQTEIALMYSNGLAEDNTSECQVSRPQSPIIHREGCDDSSCHR
jgi:hypothetical protein